ncbi:MltR family transcriptional regulator [uncultured Ruegeria sp.]|uniref:MltR family transcriptional regulator n=1 Tax=uncultured Ruegeria sp. TaxID=259304 RepID=UPI0026140AFC|nr:MltR family transcriptional regulator [uncultured Ruegeria sp.]
MDQENKHMSISEAHPHLRDFMDYLSHFNEESTRGGVLVTCGFLEQQLKDILLAFMVGNAATQSLFEGGSAPLGTFSSRIHACHALGLVTEDEYHDLNIIRKIRNEFAHRLNVSFEDRSIQNRCKNLRKRAQGNKKKESQNPKANASEARVSFATCATAVILHLVNRRAYVSRQRCSVDNWPY